MYLIPYEYIREVAILPTFDFRIFLDAKLWKTTLKYDYPFTFHPLPHQKKIHGNMVVFPPKK